MVKNGLVWLLAMLVLVSDLVLIAESPEDLRIRSEYFYKVAESEVRMNVGKSNVTVCVCR